MKLRSLRFISLLVIALCLALVAAPAAAFAGQGPNPQSAQIALCSQVDNKVSYKYIYVKRSSASASGTSSVAGFSYDEATNTLTLNNVDAAGKWLSINGMGEDFKIEVIGANTLDKIDHAGGGWGGSITFTGSGSIVLGNEGVRAGGGGEDNPSNTTITIGSGVTFAASAYQKSAVRVENTTANPGIIVEGALATGKITTTAVVKQITARCADPDSTWSTGLRLYKKDATYYGLYLSYSGGWVEPTHYKMYRLSGDEQTGFTFLSSDVVFDLWNSDTSEWPEFPEPPARLNDYDPVLAGCNNSQIVDADGRGVSTVEIAATGIRPTITMTSLPNGKAGIAYSASVAASPSGGGTITGFSLTGTAASWATISSNGTIVGTPPEKGFYTAAIIATETAGTQKYLSMPKLLSITVGADVAKVRFTEDLDDGNMHSLVVSNASANYLRTYSLGAGTIVEGQQASMGTLDPGTYEVELTSTALGHTMHYAKQSFTVTSGKETIVPYAPAASAAIADDTAVVATISNYSDLQASGMQVDLLVSGSSDVERYITEPHATTFLPSILSGKGAPYEVKALSYDAAGSTVDVTGAVSKEGNVAKVTVDTEKLKGYDIVIKADGQQLPSSCVTLAQGGNYLTRNDGGKYWLTDTDGLSVASANFNKLLASACDLDHPIITVNDGAITVRYNKLQTGASISGIVRYGSNEGAVASGVDVVASQNVGGYTHILSATTNQYGAYTLYVYPDSAVTLTVVSTDGGNISTESVIDPMAASSSQNKDLVANRQYAPIKLTVNCGENDSSLVTTYLNALDYSVLNLSTGTGEGAFNADLAIAPKWEGSALVWSNAAYVARTGGSDTYTATITGGGLTASQTCTLAATDDTFKLTASPTAGVIGHVTGGIKAQYVLAWYDGSGQFKGCSQEYSVSSEGADVASANPDGNVAGSYTVALVPATFAGALAQHTLADVTNFGVVATSWDVAVAKGQVTQLAASAVSETASEDAAYVTKPDSTLRASDTSFSDTSDILTYSGVIKLDDNLNNGKLKKLRIDVIDPMVGYNHGYKNSVTVLTLSIDGASYPMGMTATGYYEVDNLPDIALPCEYTIYASPQDAGKDAYLSLSASGGYEGGSFDEHLVGSARVERPGASLFTLSSYVNRSDVLVSGTALPGEEVKLYDSGCFVGAVWASSAGKWDALVPLEGADTTLTTVHELRAVTASGAVSDDLQVIHDPAGAQLTSLVMRYSNGAGTITTVESGGSYVFRGGLFDVEFAAAFDKAARLDTIPDFGCAVVFKVVFIDGEVKYLKGVPSDDGVTFTARLDDDKSYSNRSIVDFQCLFQPVTSSVGFDSDANTLALTNADSDELFAVTELAAQRKTAEASLTDANNWGVAYNETTGNYEATGAAAGASSVALSYDASATTAGEDGANLAPLSLDVADTITTTAEDKIDWAAFTAYANQLKDAGLRVKNMSYDYQDDINTFAWFQARGTEHMQSNYKKAVRQGSVYWRSVAYKTIDKLQEAKSNVAAKAGGHESVKVEGKPYDRYLLTDATYNAAGALEGGTFFTSVTYYVDEMNEIYSEVDMMFLASSFKEFSDSTTINGSLSTQALSSASETTMTTMEDDFLDHVPTFYGGNFTGGMEAQSSNGDLYTAAENAGSQLNAVGLVDTLMDNGGAPADAKPKDESNMGAYGGAITGGMGMKKIEENMGYRTQALSHMEFDIKELMLSSCYDKLTPVQKAAVQDSVDNFMMWRKKADGYNFWTSLVNYETSFTGIGFSLVPGGAPAATASTVSGKVSEKVTDRMINSTFGSAKITYNDAYNTIVKVIRSHAQQTNDPKCMGPSRRDGGGGAVQSGNDPSGIVYEGVIENPVEGATATLYYAADGAGHMVPEALANTAT